MVQSRGHREIRGFRHLPSPTHHASPKRNYPRKRATKAYTLVQKWGEMMEAANSRTPKTTPNRHVTWANGSCSPPPPPHVQRSTQGDAQLTAIFITGLSVENGGGCARPGPVPCTHAPPRTHTLPPSRLWQAHQKCLGGPRTSGMGANGAGTGRQEPPKAVHVFF